MTLNQIGDKSHGYSRMASSYVKKLVQKCAIIIQHVIEVHSVFFSFMMSYSMEVPEVLIGFSFIVSQI